MGSQGRTSDGVDSQFHEDLLSAVGRDSSRLNYPQSKEAVPYFNTDSPVLPLVIVTPQSSEQIAAIVRLASRGGYKVQAKGGGHSYANHGLGGQDGSVIIDMRSFQHFSIDISDWTARIGAGCLLGEMAQMLYDEGRAMPHGTCPQVGLGGHATTGGIGPASRMWGLTLDCVMEAEVVLADASVIRASEKEHQDVLFALKGAGPSFGIVTEFRLRTEPAPTEIVRFDNILSSPEPSQRAKLFKQWQTFVSDPSLSRELHAGMDVFPQKAIVSGHYFGTKEAYDRLDVSAICARNDTYNETVSKTWIDVINAWADQVRVNFAGGMPRPFYAKSLNFKASQLMPDAVIHELFEYLARAYANGVMLLVSFHLVGGAVNDTVANATAFAHRDTLYWMQFAAIENGGVSKATKGCVQGIADIITKGMPDGQFGAYLGHIDQDLSGASDAYWGSNLPKLERIKGAVDRGDMFHNPQSVPPST
ncbi:uncharacterized protein LTR77_008290 [Saxophila tyrrhenica]|uniref:FAD-binding PCMH-type domain-containing protein n=1 Tax=Saxophila tyrrhenica TaxID=1690608 RepID=A0AAV9P0G9_9PEZI|nr:hypothetical protein LTR77_008290 [Saxophila tyrrhenica]